MEIYIGTLEQVATALRGKLAQHAGHQPSQEKGLAAKARMLTNNPVHKRQERWTPVPTVEQNGILLYIYIYFHHL